MKPRWRWWGAARRLECPNKHALRSLARTNEFLRLCCPHCPAIIAVWIVEDGRALAVEITPAEDTAINSLTPIQAAYYLGVITEGAA